MALAPFIAKVFSRWRSNSSASPTEASPPAQEPEHLALGRRGEETAARHLKRQGYKILYRNFRPSQGGEIDLVCREKKTLVFVEVKTRASAGPGRPADAVGKEKAEAIERGAQTWLRMLGRPDIPVRFDIVEVLLIEGEEPRCTLIRDATIRS